jgi:hypothetical protein
VVSDLDVRRKTATVADVGGNATLRRTVGPASIRSVGIQRADLPAWEFTVNEVSPGVYRVRATRDGGITGDATGSDPDELLDDLQRWARKVETGPSPDQ